MTRATFHRLVVAFPLLLVAHVADATTIVVSPGPGTPVQDAIDAASPGDTVRLVGGGYPEAIVIPKPLKLVGPAGTYLDADPLPAVIAAGCTGTTTGITVASDGVTIRDLRVITFTEYGIDVEGRDHVRLLNVLVLPNCLGDPPVASLNVVASTRVKIDGCWVDGFDVPSTAIRIAGIAAHGNVQLRRTLGGGHDVGILLESCAPRSVRVQRSYANYNDDTGILLQDTDGIELKKNVVGHNTNAGIVIDADSDDNRIVGNDIHANLLDVSDAGTGNCWKKNVYTTGTVSSCP
jgi:parallel beta-helix repeat protein